MYGDEAQLMIEARRFATGAYTNPFNPDMLGLPSLYDFLLSLPLRFLGSTNVTAARAFSGLLGALGAPLVLLTARELGYRRRVGVVAAVALATTFWDIHFSRLALQNIMATTAATFTILCLVAAIRRAGMGPAACAGLGLAWAVNAYLSGSMVAVVAACWLAALVFGSLRWRRSASEAGGEGAPATRRGMPAWLPGGKGGQGALPDLNAPRPELATGDILGIGLVFALVALACLIPLLPWLLDPGSPLRLHMAERYILTAENRALAAGHHPDLHGSTIALLWFQLKAAAGMFTVRGDPDLIFNMPNRPLLDPLSGLLFYLGLLTAVVQRRRPSSVLLLAWLTAPIVLGVVLTTGSNFFDDPPSFTRALPALPALCLLIGVGLDTLLVAGRRAAARHRGGAGSLPSVRRVELLAAIVVTAAVGGIGVGRYVEYAQSDVYRVAFHNTARDWGPLLGKQGRVAVTGIGPVGWAGEFVTLFAPEATVCNGRWYDTWSRCPPAQIIVFDQDEQDMRRYQRSTRLSVRAGASFEGAPSFWYVQGRELPDPATVLHQVAGTR